MIKVGLIGCGFMGGMHSACYAALANLGVKVTAVADVRREYAEKLAGDAEVYATGMELIEKAGKLDMAWGGVGINGHFAFNEPPHTSAHCLQIILGNFAVKLRIQKPSACL